VRIERQTSFVVRHSSSVIRRPSSVVYRLKETEMVKIKSSEITPEHVYVSRRKFMKGIGAVALGTLAASACGSQAATAPTASPAPAATMAPGASPQPTTKADAAAETPNSFEVITNYNNYYEFTMAKEDVAPLSKDFKTTPWTVAVGGLVNNPKTYGVDELIKKFPPQERVYRLRCVEGWSLVIPWQGFPLASILKEVDPQSKARYVRFTSVLAPDQMPGQKDGYFPWPYTEGLRVDEAMNDLTLMVTGLYGKPLPPQNGAPLRVAVPWKYGFKSAKAIVKIDLVEEQPVSLWMSASPDEYGFYSNVNPDRPHPRWSQSSERRIGELGRRPTLMYNGYADEVASLYAGMDLNANF
jgi:methionine sulfoxide reductase catalytic subunit